MKKIIFTLSILFFCNLIGFCQESHLTVIYDFDGNDFDNSVTGMVGKNDSLYILCNTPNGQGKFFKIDQNGKGYKAIWEFDNLNFAPSSLIANDTVIYGTTRFSQGGGGTIFYYSLKDYSFKFIKDFNSSEVQETQVRYITDSLLWLDSQISSVDNGCIFSIKKDGNALKKIFTDFDVVKGQNPVDFTFHNDSIYIACFGGGLTYPDGVGTETNSGCFIRIKSDGTGYENIIKGGIDKGTQPQSIIIKENKLYGLFANTGNNHSVGAQFFKSNLNGSSYDSIGALGCRSLTKMLTTDSLIYGISFSQIFGINLFTGEIRIFEELLNDPNFGYDMVTNPVQLNGNVFIATQQGGPNYGGTILKWTNNPPLISLNRTKSYKSPSEIILKDLFTDPEGDSLTFTYDFDKNKASIAESNGILTIKPLQSDETEVKITASDGWLGYKTYSLKVITTNTISLMGNDDNLIVYPNPTNSILYLNHKTFESVEIFTLKGELIRSYNNPGNNIDINSIKNGIYIIKCKKNKYSYFQKLIKN